MVVICVVTPAVLMAQSDAELSKQSYAKGVKFFKAMAWDEAIAEFQKAYDLDPNPILIYNIGRCFEEKGDYLNATKYFKDFLKLPINQKQKTAALEHLKKVQALLQEELKYGRLKLIVSEAQAQVKIDSEVVGFTPIMEEIKFKVGRHTIQITKDGFADWTNEFYITGGNVTNLQVILKTSADQYDEPPKGGKPRKLLDGLPFWLTVGGGAALVVGGGVMTGMAMSLESTVEEELSDVTDQEPHRITGISQAEAYDLQDDASTYQTVSVILYATGGAAVATGLVLYFSDVLFGTTYPEETEKKKKTPTSMILPSVVPTSEGLFFTLGGTF
jgi:tetratricopeptide (TPR) repeat protein